LSRRGRGLVSAVIILATLGLGGFVVSQRAERDPTGTRPSDRAAPPCAGTTAPRPTGEPDALERRVLADLEVFTDWLEEGGASGFIGEVGWPGDDRRWNELAQRWFRAADETDLWVTTWATGSWWGEYDLLVYEPASCGMDPRPQAAVLEANLGSGRGVNVNGAEFGIGPNLGTGDGGSFSNSNPGTPGTDYRYEDRSFLEGLARRGVQLVRLPVRWERIQPVPGGSLEPDEVDRLTRFLADAHDVGVEVVPTIMNYGAYWVDAHDSGAARREPIGGDSISVDDFADLWRRLAVQFSDADGIAAWGLMNEPVDLPGGASSWERASQAAVTAIRGTGDRRTIAVPGYHWSTTARFREAHPDGPWVRGGGDILYEGHQYFDEDLTGDYGRSYDEELTRAEGAGH
jgi:hypothetical protein